MIRISPAKENDLKTILKLMEENGLPKEGIPSHLETTLVLREKGRLIGNVTLEIYGKFALLRSLAVAKEVRGRGLGYKLTRAALELARTRGVSDVFLLTTTARVFFEMYYAFKPVERDCVPDEVKQSVEFVSACPASAQAMTRSLEDITALTTR